MVLPWYSGTMNCIDSVPQLSLYPGTRVHDTEYSGTQVPGYRYKKGMGCLENSTKQTESSVRNRHSRTVVRSYSDGVQPDAALRPGPVRVGRGAARTGNVSWRGELPPRAVLYLELNREL